LWLICLSLVPLRCFFRMEESFFSLRTSTLETICVPSRSWCAIIVRPLFSCHWLPANTWTTVYTLIYISWSHLFGIDLLSLRHLHRHRAAVLCQLGRSNISIRSRHCINPVALLHCSHCHRRCREPYSIVLMSLVPFSFWKVSLDVSRSKIVFLHSTITSLLVSRTLGTVARPWYDITVMRILGRASGWRKTIISLSCHCLLNIYDFLFPTTFV